MDVYVRSVAVRFGRYMLGRGDKDSRNGVVQAYTGCRVRTSAVTSCFA